MKIKPFIYIVCVLLTVTVLFSACGKNEVNEAEPTTNEPGTTAETVISTEAPTTTQATVTTAVQTTKNKETETLKATTTTAPTTKVTTTNAPTTTTPPDEIKQEPGINVADAAASIAARTGMFEERLSAGSASRALSIFGINASDVSEAAYYTASAAVAEELLIVKATDSSAAANVAAQMRQRKAMQIEDYADYVPKEVPKLQNAVIVTNGNYVVYCVANDGSGAASAVNNLF